MTEINKLTLGSKNFPADLRVIPSPPQQLFSSSDDLAELLGAPRVAIVGSRKISPYGREVTSRLAQQLAERGVVIISGLALGVDGVAHQAALAGGGMTIAVLPGGLDKIYPASHHALARQIAASGGALVTEYSAPAEIFKPNFIARNRLIAGLAQAVLITEAAEKSGSLHTARFALEQGKDVMAVPGNITSLTSVGANNLLKSGAAPVTSYLDVLHVLGLEDEQAKASQPLKGRNEQETLVLKLISDGVSGGELLLTKSKLPIEQFNQTLTMLEITGRIRSLGADNWAIC